MTTKAVHMEATFGTSRYDAAMKHMRSTTKTTTSFISNAWLKAAGSIYGAMKAWDMLKLGAKANQQAQAFENMAASYGANADRIIKKLREMSGGAIDTMTLIEKAGTAMMMGIKPDELVQLMEIARATSKLTGQTVTKAFEDISLGVGRQSRMILDNLGIIVKQGEANQKYAESLGKTAAALTDAEKKQAFMNATIEAGAELIKRISMETKSAAEMFQSMEAFAKNSWVWISKGMIEVVKSIVIVWTQAGKIINQTISQIAKGWGLIFGLVAKLPGAKWLQFDDLSVALLNIADNFDRATVEANKFTAALLDLGPSPKPTWPVGDGYGGGEGADTGAGEGTESTTQAKFDTITDIWLTHFQGIEDAKSRHLGNMAQMDLDHEAQALALYEQHARNREMQIQQMEQRIQNIKQQSAQIQLGIVQTLGAALISTLTKDSKTAFLLTKMLEMGMATVSAFAAHNLALASPPGPPYTIPLAAAVLKLGMLKVAAIGATAMGSMMTGGSGGGGGSGNVSSPEATPPEIINPNESKGSLTINIQGDFIGDDQYIDSLVEKINNAQDRDVHVNYANYSGEIA